MGFGGGRGDCWKEKEGTSGICVCNLCQAGKEKHTSLL